MGQDFITSHAKQNACRAHLAGEPAAKARHNQDGPHRVVEKHSAHALAHVHERGVAAGETRSRMHGMIAGPVLGPDALREVDLRAAEERCQQHHQHDGEENVASRIVRVLGQGR